MQNSAGFNLGTGDIELPINTGFELTDGEVYRFVISADNQFTMDGYNAGPLVTGVEGSTQFVPYLERSYIGQEETLVVTQGAINLLGRSVDFTRDHTDRTILIDINNAGYSHHVNTIYAYEQDELISIGNINGGTPYFKNINYSLVTIAGANTYTTQNAVINALNALFQVTPLGLGGDYISTLPVLDGVDITANFAEGQTPITGDLYGVAGDTSQHGARIWSDETIDESNEYYEVKITGKGQFMLGLYSVADGDLTEIQNNTGNGHTGYKWANAFYNYGSYIAPWTIYGSNSSFSYGPGWTFSGNDKMLRYKQQLQDNFANGDPVLFKVGIGANGHIEVYYFDEGVTNQYIMTARSSYTLPTGQYGLLVKLVNGTVRLVETPKRVATDPVAPILTYYFIESPDTEFSYPLFATEEEANYVDIQNGGSGTSHTHVYVDDPTNTVWYMPSTGGTMNGATAPSNSANVTYNEIATQNDDLFAPVAFSDQTITVNEGDALNLQLHPTGNTGFVTSIGGIPAWTLVNGYLQGTAPEVAGDTSTNPSDTTTVTVYRTNSYGTSQGTLTIVINNTTAPIITPITGVTDEGGTALIDSDTMDDGSVVSIDNVVDNGNRFVISKEWLDTYVLPKVTSGTGDKSVFIGFPTSSADWSNGVDASDFELCFEIFADDSSRSQSNHRLRTYVNGSIQANVGIASLTNGLYDYVLINDNTTLSLGALIDSQGHNSSTTVYNYATLPWYWSLQATTTAGNKNIVIATKGTDLDLDLQYFAEYTEPTAPTNLTSWNKALDFSGSNQRAIQVSTQSAHNPMMMGGSSSIVAGNSDLTKTSAATSARPWATTVVFKYDGNNSNQHIWNAGEGVGADNIYLRISANGYLYFGWGRDGSGINECSLGGVLGTNYWWGVYIGHKGQRYSSANATADNLADAFDIYLMRINDVGTAWEIKIGTKTDGSGNRSIESNWTQTGYRMDRATLGQLSIGGRGSNRSFHGKVAAFMTTTLKTDESMPTTTEVETMITDPMKWAADYKEGNTYRNPLTHSVQFSYAPLQWQVGNQLSSYATQIWLMGDGSNDNYSNMIRNRVNPSDQNYTKLNLISMVSNDIETININGLS